MLKTAKIFWIFLALSVISSVPTLAQHAEEHSAHAEESHGEGSHEEESFNAGEFVIEHVSDAHDWHIVSFGDIHISIPLPIIVYSKNPELHDGKSFYVFMSSKFHHGHEDYKGFRLSQTEENKGKIVELDEHGLEAGKPTDISITKTVAGILVSVVILIWVLLAVASSAKKNKGKAPSGLQNALEPIIVFIRDEVAKPAIGEKKYEKFMPFLLTVFFFILINNFMGLIPIPPFGANVTGNIAVTMVLALFTFAITTISGNKHYWKEIYNPDVPWWLKFPLPLMPIVELSGVITKPFVLMVRLFANMMAGHMIVTVFVSLIFIFASLFNAGVGLAASPISVAFSVFILMLDVLVSFIQAYVFTLLSALYFGMATADHH
ncbi:F0F1 ATP synthase subunit A [Maribellus maritimus]|uniref:F0F1 ATP synthase subunit A n=1 Tax=Maribellus maritimus TaxID=2870838 RepID=UPI001EEAD692|nr:F0F1 ATP synthase subunit A [Maribellus maritimus]MCG6188169.1 F0F1 ATP synthase subunit A [Maribellus maritimus]